MNARRIRVRRERPTAVALAIALCATMLAVYVLTLGQAAPDVVESMAVAPRVTREIEFAALEGWCVRMAECDTQQAARVAASAWVNRGAAGYVTEADDGWAVLGAVYDARREAERVAKRLASEEGIPAEAIRMRAEPVRIRVTGPEAQIDAIAAADELLRAQTAQLGDVALQVDREEVAPDAARALCALAATETARAGDALKAIPGAAESQLCAALIQRLDALNVQLTAISGDTRAAGAALSGLLRCAQLENFVGQVEDYERLAGKG